MEECIFCKIAKSKISENIIYQNSNFFSIPNINPKVKGHALVISRKHFETVLDLPNLIGSDLLDCIKNTTLKLFKEDVKGFNVANNNFEIAGQVVHHVHFHILPRREDDNFNLGI